MLVRNTTLLLGIYLMLMTAPIVQADQSVLAESISDYLDFTEYQGGSILPEQIPKADWKKFHIIDTRSAQEYASDHILGAVNIEWRKVIEQRHDIPQDKPVIVYCNLGSVSSQAAFGLKLLGYDNVKILAGGFVGFNSKGGLLAHERALASEPGDTDHDTSQAL